MDTFEYECAGIADRLRAVIECFLERIGAPECNEVLEYVLGRYAIGEYPSERSMGFFVEYLEAFSPDFFRILQQQVLAEYPRWSLFSASNEPMVYIHPRSVALGQERINGPFDRTHPVYVRWLEAARLYREQRYGALRRQLAVVKRLIPGAMAAAKKNGFTLLAAFDRYEPHRRGHVIWLLQTQRSDELHLDCDFSPSRTSAVDWDGTLFPEYCPLFVPEGEVVPPFWAVTYLVDQVHGQEFRMLSEQREEKGRFQVQEVIFDEDLKAEES